MSAAAFVASKAYNIANATISTYYGAQEAYSALAGIPVVGPELGIAAAAAAIVAGVARVDEIAKQSPTGFAFGGEASTPTLALLGEGSDTDIIAPKRDFIQVWREDLMPVALKDMRSAPQQGPGSSSTSDPVVAALKKEFAALKKTIVNNTPVTMISSDTDYHRYQKTVDRAARIKKMRLL